MRPKRVTVAFATIFVTSVACWVLWKLLASLPAPHNLWLSCLLFVAILTPIISALGWITTTIIGARSK